MHNFCLVRVVHEHVSEVKSNPQHVILQCSAISFHPAVDEQLWKSLACTIWPVLTNVQCAMQASKQGLDIPL